MKKIVAVLLALLIIGTLPVTAFAADQSKSTKLTTSVPGASYTLNIPENQKIAYGTENTCIGDVTVTESAGFSLGKDLIVALTFDDFNCENPAVNTTIPYEFRAYYGPEDSNSYHVIVSGGGFVFEGHSDGQVDEKSPSHTQTGVYYERIGIHVSSEAWENAMAGNYSSTITFSARILQR